ncbi:MAG: glycosyltransferase family 2 protein [Firmicutes bacterium]|nr:glycosyltransferase family 2 protein [Bacillota bacterium]
MEVTVLIPAYNEGNTIESIINTLKTIKSIKEVLVINDGSTDNTAELAAKAGARVISLPENLGKGAALQRGIEEISSRIIIMLDADLIGLNKVHITNLLEPIYRGEADMTVGVFNHGRGITDLAQFFSPNLSGQRAVKAEMISDMSSLKKAGYGVEIAINQHVKKKGRVKYVDLPDLTHIMKEEKRGIIKGVIDRSKMYWDIFRVLFNKLKV